MDCLFRPCNVVTEEVQVIGSMREGGIIATSVKCDFVCPWCIRGSQRQHRVEEECDLIYAEGIQLLLVVVQMLQHRPWPTQQQRTR